MKVTNIRLGFATNSSSAHSVVLAEGMFEKQDYNKISNDFEFGWEQFQLTEAYEKMAYLMTGVYIGLNDFPEYAKIGIVAELFGLDAANTIKVANQYCSYSGPYIDHQSSFTLANPKCENFPLLVAEAAEFFCDKRLTIYGGNDNNETGCVGDEFHWGDLCPIRIRRDGNGYVIFNWNTGAKIRLGEIDKASKPELVDVKITDFCPYQCSFCYQSSTPEGKKGEAFNVSKIIKSLGIKGIGVFEVAIGGGEPTACDHFENTINLCIENYIKPNFTTFAVDWLLDEAKVAAANKCGGIGVSVHNKKDLNKVVKIDQGTNGPKVTAQHVYGTLSVDETIELIAECSRKDIHLLLLGYKDVGFGKDHKKRDMSGIVKKAYIPRGLVLSIDTAMVNDHPEFLSFIKANKLLYTSKEGSHSMYIDAVEMKIGPSSYCEVNQMTNLPEISRKHRGKNNNILPLVNFIGEKFSNY